MVAHMGHPYEHYPDKSFWKLCLQDEDFLAEQAYAPKFQIAPNTKIATAGSCFAQHLTRSLRASNVQFLDVEPAPQMMSRKKWKQFGYDIYSARYGNIYFARQLRQLVEEVLNPGLYPCEIWEKDGGFVDALRPSVEPFGLQSPEEVEAHRAQHIARLKELFSQTDVFVFTMGLTESWRNKQTGRVYPIAPGAGFGNFDESLHELYVANYEQVKSDMEWTLDQLKTFNPEMKFILTVSPVPMVATAEPQHALVATNSSKSILRAVAGELTKMRDDVDYFPSYDLITASFYAGQFYDQSLRHVNELGLTFLMEILFSAHPDIERKGGQDGIAAIHIERPENSTQMAVDDIVCEEELLNTFAS